MSFRAMLPPSLKSIVQQWLQEDIPSFDIGGFVVGEKPEKAEIFFKMNGVVAGIPFAQAVFDELNCTVTWTVEEGTDIMAEEGNAKIRIAIVSGRSCDILKAERTVLNIMSRASGIATLARRARDIGESAGWHGSVAGTRKTTPGFRMVEKYAMLVGGIAQHRYDLSSMIMLKDNHIWSTGSITNAVHVARQAAGFSLKIEVECQSLEDALEACRAGADVVMLDNVKDLLLLASNASRIKSEYPHVYIEASGGITLDNMSGYMSPHVDVISSSMFSQGYGCIDISMKIRKHDDISEV
jgi:nicotinate-nucleotide pyrophosphorylase (carboxylating)